ncbi:MAG: helix-turn-helix domain-containing protein [Anaerolineae bacterium]|nr:helix-turn-helix domain-containing protein [Anaerolineae bacterium]
MRKLAGLAKVTPTTISDIINEKVGVSPELCLEFARVFNVSPERVFRLAGILPPAPQETSTTRELIYMFSQLDEADRERVMQITRTFLERRVVIGEATADA